MNEVLEVDNFTTDYNIYREKDNIDLLIENDDSVIIIENKTESDINGVKSKSSGKIESQLSKLLKLQMISITIKNCIFIFLHLIII